MAENSSYAKGQSGVADGGTVIIDGSGAGTGAVNITELGGGADAEIRKELDPDGDGTWEVSTLVDNPTGEWHSQDNDFLASQSQNVRTVLKNVSGGTADLWAVGFEVTD